MYHYRITYKLHLTSGTSEYYVIYQKLDTLLTANLESQLVLNQSEAQYDLFAELFAYVTVDKVEYLGHN